MSKASKSFFRYNVLQMVSETVKDLLLSETELLVWTNELKTIIKQGVGLDLKLILFDTALSVKQLLNQE